MLFYILHATNFSNTRVKYKIASLKLLVSLHFILFLLRLDSRPWIMTWDFPGGSLVESVLPMQGAQARTLAAVVQSLSCVPLFVTLWTAVLQASLPFTISWSLLKLMSIESVMPSNQPILCRPLLLLPSIFSNIRVFSNELALRIRWIETYTYVSVQFSRSVMSNSLQPHGL